VNEAHEVLSDQEKRAKYDRYGEHWKRADQFAAAGVADDSGFGNFGGRGSAGGRRAPNTVNFDFGNGGDDVFESIFGSFFGGTPGTARGQRVSSRGQDVEANAEVTLEEAFAGTTRVMQVASGPGKTRRLEVRIPPGVRTGSRVRIAGEGGQGGASPGDLYLNVTVRPHYAFERKGDDLYVDAAVSVADAILGGEVKVPTLKGTMLALTIPAETQNGRVFRLAGQGMPKLNSNERGDLYARIKVILPTNLTERERELVRELKRLRG
jgi:DnaJ-class molecular chaperone